MPVLVRADREEAQVREWLNSLTLPDSVVEFRPVFGSDWEGDPKVNIFFILKDSLSEKEFDEEATRIRTMVWESHRQTDFETWPFPYFRSKSEQDEFDAEDEKKRLRLEKRRKQ